MNYAFVFKADHDVQSVHVAGTFNTWNQSANSLVVDSNGVTGRASLPLEVGRYLYKFIVNGERWIAAP